MIQNVIREKQFFIERVEDLEREPNKTKVNKK